MAREPYPALLAISAFTLDFKDITSDTLNCATNYHPHTAFVATQLVPLWYFRVPVEVSSHIAVVSAGALAFFTIGLLSLELNIFLQAPQESAPFVDIL